MRIHTKMTISFMSVALLSVILAGGVAFYLATGDMERQSRETALQAFRDVYTAYVKAYGSVEAAMTAEGLDSFVSRTCGMQPLSQDLPYKHLVLAPAGEVLVPAAEFKVGDMVPASLLAEAVPVKVNGSVVALLVSVENGAVPAADFSRFHDLRRALYLGGTIAVCLAGLLGFILTRWLIAPLRALGVAVDIMRTSSDEVYQVEVVSDDELSQLTEAFNEMNVALVDARVEVEQLAIRDPLANLYNRRHFDEQMRQFYESATRYGQPLAVMIGDLDNMREINDAFGNEVGDLVLERVAEIITQTTRKSDVVARYSGEEVVVLFANTTMANAMVSCEKIRQAVETHAWSDYHPELSVTISIGLCDNAGLPSASAMISRADQLVSEAKNQGRNRVVGC